MFLNVSLYQMSNEIYQQIQMQHKQFTNTDMNILCETATYVHCAELI